ncbi:unnamed protein product [Moneuplotes crassus]|uniref:BZIP domain-containing protein n=1 Tax=Euplotes crassus TaxID=5936 RepID=A0AAD1XMH3_EUPCR|nr:unnamed protein product [Moneuplotes crassus]
MQEEGTELSEVFTIQKYARNQKDFKSNMVRSREYRKRRKEYITKLEQANKKLSDENIILKKENEELKKLVQKLPPPSHQENDIKSRIDKNEHFAYYKIPKMMSEDPDRVRLTQIAMACNDNSEWNPDRITIIKKAFRDIIHYLLSKDNKCFVAACKNSKMSQCIKKFGKKRTIKGKMKDVEGGESKELGCSANLGYLPSFSDSLVEYLKANGTEYWKTTKANKNLVRKLITVRNEILQNILKKGKFFEESNISQALVKEDFASICELVGRLDGTKYLSPHYLWELPVRDPDSDEYNGYELSE